MFSNSILFAVLAILASPALASKSAWRKPCYVNGRHGVLDGALCLVAEVDVDKRLSLGDGLLHGVGSVHGHHTQHDFGWFHPGPYNEGDRCWQGDREGLIGGALCIIADLQIGDADNHHFNGWFDQPYYGYGHNFGWYHPGPYVNGDRCFQDGWNGYVRDTLCVQVDATATKNGHGGVLHGLGLGKRLLWGPDYWQEPRFSPHHNFGWFHDGDFAEGDRCWSDGWYGSVKDSLCVLVDLNLKRGALHLDGVTGGLLGGGNGLLSGGRSSYRNGERCFKRGGWGRWWHDDCDVVLDADAVIELGDHAGGPFRDGDKCWRSGSWGSWRGNDCDLLANLDIQLKRSIVSQPYLFRDDPRLGRGAPCDVNGQRGILRDAVCIIADVSVGLGRRDHEDEVAHSVASSFRNEEDGSEPDEPTSFEDTEEEDGWDYEKRSPLLSFTPGDNRGHALGKTVSNLVDGIKTRGLLGGLGGGNGLEQLNGLELDQLDFLHSLGGAGHAYGAEGGHSDLLGGLTEGGLLGRRELGHTLIWSTP